MAARNQRSEDKNPVEAVEDHRPRHTSNEYVLNVAFFSFLLFTVTQASFALIAQSQSMFADSMAMSVDAFTYLFNLVAERLKHRTKTMHEESLIPAEELRRKRKRTRLYLELIPPLMSVMALIVVSIQALGDAITTIIKVSAEGSEEKEDDEPNVRLMLIFSALNLGLDIMNVTCFAKAQNFSLTTLESCGIRFGSRDEGGEHEEVEISSQEHSESSSSETNPLLKRVRVSQTADSSYETSSGSDDNGEGILGISSPNYGTGDAFSLDVVYGDESDDEADSFLSQSTQSSLEGGRALTTNNATSERVVDWGLKLNGLDDISEEAESSGDESGISVDESEDTNNGLNLNMCSAYTHVMADTLRSIAVLVAAGIATAFKGIDGSMADASAAVVVSVIIAISLGPLIAGLLGTWKELQELHKEQADYDRTKKIEEVENPWMHQFQNLPVV
jgi:Co/Zn/Cd efflux system component